MSSQKGSGSRSRPQKYQNSHAFKNTLHDTSHRTKKINSIQVVNVCDRCKHIIEWKIKYKKFKLMKAPGKCTKCDQKCVKHAYHIMCGPCASKNQVCPKCGEKEIVFKTETEDEPLKLDRELRLLLKKLPERRRRTFMRYMNRKAQGTENEVESDKPEGEVADDESKNKEEECSEAGTENNEDPPLTRDDLLAKLQSLMVSKKDDDDLDDFGSDCHEEDSDTESDSDDD